MTRILKQILIAAFFLAQLGAVWWLNRIDRPEHEGDAKAIERYGFHLRERAKAMGIDFRHENAGQLDPKLARIMPIIVAMGASVTVVDFDRDGNQDLYVTTGKEGGKNALYRNLGNGKFEDVAERMGVADLNRPGTGVCMGAVWGDFDGDGYEDLLVYKWGKPELYRSVKGERFENVTAKAGLPEWVNANSAVWVDFDRDGKLDLFIAGYWPESLHLDAIPSTKIMPESFEYAKNGGRKYLLKNLGGGKFQDVTKDVGITSTRWTLGVTAIDLCGTGYPDIVLANDYGVSEFLCNQGGKRFVEIGQATKIGETPKSGMNVSAGDILNNGRFSLYVSNITEPGILPQGNNLWIPDRTPDGSAPKYRNAADEMGVSLGGWSWAAQFGDLNNDGYQDLYVTNGYVSADKSKSYWYDYGIIAGSHKEIIQDASRWPEMKGRSLGGFQAKRLWWNRGGRFVDVAAAVGVHDTHDGRAVALVDLRNRGVLDVVVANQNGPLLVYENTVAPGRDWVQFDLKGKDDNTSAIGAQVRVFWTMKGSDRTQEQAQAITGGTAYASQNMRRLHFGLGEGAEIEKVDIRWPSGGTQTVTVPEKNKLHEIQEVRQ